MNDAFADDVGAVVQGVLGLEERLRSGTASSLEAVRSELIRLVDHLAKRGKSRPEIELDYELARCALVCWIDALFSVHLDAWPHAEEFRAQCLELHYPELRRINGRVINNPGRPEGAYLFYEMADLAKTRPGVDAIETFLLCVGLGFQGRHYLPERRREWLADVRKHIQERRKAEGSLDTKPSAIRGELTRLSGSSLLLGTAVLVSASLLIATFVFIAAVHSLPR